MHPILALALVVIAGVGVARLWRPPYRHPAVLDTLLATGVPFVLLGALLGPGLGVFDAPAMRLLTPVLALGIGWIGATFGARLEWRMLRAIRARTWLVGATLALPVLLMSTLTAWTLGRLIPPLANAWGGAVALIPVAILLGAAATTAASDPGPKLGRRNALLDTAFGAAVAAALAPRTILLTLVVSGAIGGLFVLLARSAEQDNQSEAGVGVRLFGAILWSAGASYALGLSPFFVCALMTAISVSFSPPAARQTIQRLLRSWELPLYAAFLIVVGALLRSFTPWLIVAAIALAVVRVAVRWVTVRFGLDQVDPVWRSFPHPPPPEFAFPPLRQGPAAVALAAGFGLVRGDSGAVLTTVVLSVLAVEAIVALTPLTARPSHAEVS